MPSYVETSDLQWFDINSLPDNINPPVKEAIAGCVNIIKLRRDKL
ncbi:hypothetical protein EDD66_107127 [Mobilisporobacter senegalensis]|uniref:Uncharacterized protein n=1 Tax=Mobilisporobacter senegalensis TaxID=1329262 RepID=A0A3N1XKI3_9FIRM|nr:hypothetical protein [Mobilisporobacter senegalensis]ROR27213.1 hypothetical protein EDD66_107127 [Mobilisporobacter senegalensis]